MEEIYRMWTGNVAMDILDDWISYTVCMDLLQTWN